jgi:hypothetical protein
MAANAVTKFIAALQSLVRQGLSKQAAEQFAKNEFGEISKFLQKRIDDVYKNPKGEGIESIKIKDEVFDDTVVKLPIDDTGQPFNPNNPLKQYGKPKKSKKMTDVEEAFLNANPISEKPTFRLNKERFKKDFNVTDEEVEKISLLSPEDQQKKVKEYIDKDFKERIELSDYDVTDLEPNAEGGIVGYYTGGMVDVEPNLSDIGHGSDALMARTRLVSPGSQSTTSTGLNYLLAEDNDNIRVPFNEGKTYKQKLEEEIKKRLKYKRQGMEFDKPLGPEGTFNTGNPPKVYELAEGGRIGFSKGKGVDLLRRGFLKTMGVAGAGIAALKTGLLGLGGKGATKQAAKELITTPAAAGKPEWFDALVTRVIREGDDVTKTMATKDREIVYRKKIDDETEVMVTQDLDEGVTRIDIDDSTRNVMGYDDPPTVSLQVTDEIVEEGGARIKPEFKATENDYRNYATDPDGGYETEFVENTVENTKDLTSDLTKVKSYATNKKETMKEFVESKKRKDNVKYANENPASYAADRGPQYDPSDFVDDMADDFASGGIARMIGE